MDDYALDFLVFVVTAAVVTALGMLIIIPNSKNIAELRYKEYSDKTAMYTLETGEETIDNEKSYYTADELVLVVMSQTYYMPEPKKINIAGDILEITEDEGFVPNSAAHGNKVYNSIKKWFNEFKNSASTGRFEDVPDELEDCKFSIRYSYNDHKDLQDEDYSLFIILTEKGSIEPKYYRCETLV